MEAFDVAGGRNCGASGLGSLMMPCKFVIHSVVSAVLKIAFHLAAQLSYEHCVDPTESHGNMLWTVSGAVFTEACKGFIFLLSFADSDRQLISKHIYTENSRAHSNYMPLESPSIH